MDSDDAVTLMLCGDVMLGRGIDQILPHPSPPALHERYVQSALGYLAIAERRNGPIPRPAPFSYVWGDALDELDRRRPDLRIINLETAVTHSDQAEPKGINYRMSPENVPCLIAASIDCCSLANNHVLDWGSEGLLETIESLDGAGIRIAGAGRDEAKAGAPAILALARGGRVLVYAVACRSSGVPYSWSAGPGRPGVSVIDGPSEETARDLAARIALDRRSGDIVVLSIHWGGNWGYAVSTEHRAFAQQLVDSGQVDIFHGHSSHHFKAVEVYQGRPIFYGCGDFLNDYEGIGRHEEYRSDLVLMYLVKLAAADGSLLALEMVPFRIRNFRLGRVDPAEAEWVRQRMDRECRLFGGTVSIGPDHALTLA